MDKNSEKLAGDFKNADLSGSKFINCIFVNANFQNANLENASFTCCEINDNKIKRKLDKKTKTAKK